MYTKKGFAPLPAPLGCPVLCVWWHFGRSYASCPTPKPGVMAVRNVLEMAHPLWEKNMQ